jgi:hypothetical protein
MARLAVLSPVMDRISPSALRYVIIGLTACAGVGLWMGLSDSLRRNTPVWEGGQSAVPLAAQAGPPDAVAFDAKASKALAAPPPSPAPAAKLPETKAALLDAQDAAEKAPPLAIPPPGAKPPAAKTPPAKAPAPKTAPSDPIGDLVQEQTAPAPPPPEVPF